MFSNKAYEFMIFYKIPELKIEARIIVQSISTGKAEETLKKYLEKKHHPDVKFVITHIDELGESKTG